MIDILHWIYNTKMVIIPRSNHRISHLFTRTILGTLDVIFNPDTSEVGKDRSNPKSPSGIHVGKQGHKTYEYKTYEPTGLHSRRRSGPYRPMSLRLSP